MPRLPRFDLPGYPLHVVQRGNNRQAVLFEDSDYRANLDWLWLWPRHFQADVAQTKKGPVTNVTGPLVYGERN